jgi:O-antigen ligase
VTVGALTFAFIFPLIARPIVAPAITWMIGLVPSLSRGSVSSSDISLNGREYIWAKSMNFWGDRTSDWGELFGYGAQGQFHSGASRSYAQIFGSSLQNPKMASTHNSMLQQVFDGGIIGAVLLGIAIIVCVALWVARSRVDEPYAAAALAMSLSLVISSVTEVSLAPGMGQETLLVFAGLLFAACAKLQRSDDQSAGVNDLDTVSGPVRRLQLQGAGVAGRFNGGNLNCAVVHLDRRYVAR